MKLDLIGTDEEGRKVEEDINGAFRHPLEPICQIPDYLTHCVLKKSLTALLNKNFHPLSIKLCNNEVKFAAVFFLNYH